VEEFPWGLPSDELISMAWDGLLSSVMTFTSIQLDLETSLYFEFNDGEEFGPHFLAVANGLSAGLAQVAFLNELFRSNGATFNTGVFGSPPVEITSCFPVAELVEPFLAVADRAIEYGCDDFWEEVIQLGSRQPEGYTSLEFDVSTELGRRKDIEAYLASVYSLTPSDRKH
jgi:hypothetical protein